MIELNEISVGRGRLRTIQHKKFRLAQIFALQNLFYAGNVK